MTGLRVGVVVFPGSLDDGDALRALETVGHTAVPLWHGEADLQGVDAVVLPGGFSYGDYMRCGALASRSPVFREIRAQALRGLPVLGICNGFQILTEAQLLPGALMRNSGGSFLCREQALTVDNTATAFTGEYKRGERILIPLKSGEGCYTAPADELRRIEGEGQVVFRYEGSAPNGSAENIAGVCNAAGNVLGLMPHPEHAVEAGYGPGLDGRRLFSALSRWLEAH